MKSQILDGIPTILCEDLNQANEQDGYLLIDVRRPEEFVGELGHIVGAQLFTLGPDLSEFLETCSQDQEIIFICRSGARSGQATLLSRELGFQNSFNLGGGMIRWNALQYKIEKIEK